MDESIKQKIDADIKNNKVFLYMKGNPDFPQCGFSAQAIEVLKHHNVKFESFNVLEDDVIRNAIKEYSDWPTIPQLYINGEFIGGCDVVMELHTNGELKKLLT
ncbi:Glutaredoxin-related protein [hydrothermal vent metagenome]|uniref:Glutaredoxin-related protein n=1 Tax=hydrothermal vent metagenome TaxID=652676 RepID=A0A3B1D392_9ZZZZ